MSFQLFSNEVHVRVIALVLNQKDEPHFRSVNDFKTDALLEIAHSRTAAMREMGKERAEGSVTFFAGELVKAANEGEGGDVDRALSSLTMCCWLVDLIYGGVSESEVRSHDLHFVVRDDGAIARTYAPAGSPEPDVEAMMAKAVWPDR
ncbi:hypothetical protein [Burkholderia gladioli]|uniref:hypothetical protein n=1 Tax=Burkholderia gladioli TaxID=28095 RepID=UPI0016414D89|nr:hypothetical protein [Burkholderia gladioli]MBJ9711964.1 hypothetical protein [Burkholderia gladioli]MDZ4041540.1 hypothetical protein [Burkholderia gladioli pv. alliicola]